MTKQEALQQKIEGLRQNLPELRSVLLATNEGLPVAYSLSGNADPNRIAAMSVTVLSMSKRISNTLNVGALNEASVYGEEGRILLYAVGATGVLSITAPTDANIGLLNMEARSLAKELSALMNN